jgi:hypothetical protein
LALWGQQARPPSRKARSLSYAGANATHALFVRARVLFGGRRVQPLARRATSSVALCACVRSSCFARRAATNSLDLGLSLLGVMGTTGEYVLPLARSASCNQASVSLTDASNEKRKSTAKVSPQHTILVYHPRSPRARRVRARELLNHGHILPTGRESDYQVT